MKYDPMKKALVNYNYEAAKRLENIKSFQELGFSNSGALQKDTRPRVKIPLSAGMYNFLRQMLP